MTYEYPIAWPNGLPRTKYPQRSRFDTSEERTKRLLENELRLLNATNVIVTTNVELRHDGRPYANQRMDDPGVAVYFTRKGIEQCIACDKWNLVKDNLMAVAKTVDALRGIDRWGTGEMVDAAFRGFTALPPGDANAIYVQPSQAWHEVLEVSPTASPDIVRAAYRSKAAKAHPDQGGSEAEFSRIQKAYEEAQR